MSGLKKKPSGTFIYVLRFLSPMAVTWTERTDYFITGILHFIIPRIYVYGFSNFKKSGQYQHFGLISTDATPYMEF